MTAFDDKYMTHRRHIAWRGPIIADAIQGALPVDEISTVLDLGCATGDIAAALRALGVRAWGLDSSPAAGECLPWQHMIYCDICHADQFLRQGWEHDLGTKLPVALVICLEVLSVVPDEARGDILRNAMRLGRILLVNHLRVKDAAALRCQGWTLDHTATARLRHLLEPWATKQAMKALYRTGEFWRKRPPESGDSRPESRAAGAPPAGRAPSGNPGDPIFRLAHGMTCENFGVKNPYDRPDGHGNGDGI